MAEQAAVLLDAPAAYDRQATSEVLGARRRRSGYDVLIKRIEAQERVRRPRPRGLYRGLAAEMGLKLVDLAQLTRIALTGRTASPPIFEVAGASRQGGDGRAPRGARAVAARRRSADVESLRLARHGQSVVERRAPLPGRTRTCRSPSSARARPRRSAPCAAAGARRRASTRARSSARGRRPRSPPPRLGLPLTAVARPARALARRAGRAARSTRVRARRAIPYARWVRDPVDCLPPGGEPLADVQRAGASARGSDIAAAHPERRATC